MSFGEYSFLPWLRRGISNQIETPAAAKSRAAVPVSVRVRSGAVTADVPPKSVALVGPGDLRGVEPTAVVRTEPLNGITNFEPNYLPYVEFYDEDFAWRYTPDKPDAATHRLVPWVMLLVLQDHEFTRVGTKPLPSIELTTEAIPEEALPPEKELWAWAHVHVNMTLASGQPNLDVLGTFLHRNPDSASCRLLSPRKLRANTRYRAFVVPSFEVGRLAGLGLPVPDTTPGTQLALPAARRFPVYYQWWFSTGAAGDFEELVTALQPRDVHKDVGIRKLDVQQPGFHMPVTTGQTDDAVGLEGALLAPTAEPIPVEPDCNLPEDLAIQVNRPTALQSDGVAAAGEAEDEDPVISVPLYGRWHALVDRVKAFTEHRNWINELNTDPRYRTVAGFGTKVIQKNQESYMKLAWDQIGDVLSLNRKIVFLQLSAKANAALYVKSLAPLPPPNLLAVGAPVLTKVLGSPVTVHALVQQSRLPRAAVSGPMRKQLRPRGRLARLAFGPPSPARVNPIGHMIAGLNEGSLTAAPSRPAPDGPTYDNTLEQVVPSIPAWLRWLARHRLEIAMLLVAILFIVLLLWFSPALLVAVAIGAAVGAVAYRRLSAIAKTIDTVEAFSPSRLTPEAIESLPPNDAFVLPAAGPATPVQPGGGPDSVQGARFRTAALAFHTLLADRPGPLPDRPALALPAVQKSLLRALRPASAFMSRYSATLVVANNPISQYLGTYRDAPASSGAADPDPRIVPVMAHPDIKLPMYRPLKDLQKDNFVPNLHLVPPDTISLMKTNPRVIESYMVGLNHEFARELLWREYPTDQRPSTFRQFWDPSNYVDTEGLSAEALAEKVRDIKKIHEWLPEATLGVNGNRIKDDKPRVVLVIRGELLKRYPNTIIYAQKARWGDPPHYENQLSLYDETGAKAHQDLKDPNFRFPMFRASVEPDIYFIGFDLLVEEVRGDPTLEETAEGRARVPADKLGWFFVLQEVVGEPRFGLDEEPDPNTGSDVKWDNLAWQNLGTPPMITLVDGFVTEPTGTQDAGAKWNSHSADMAFILYQKPVLVAVHSRRMLANVRDPQ